MDQGIFTIDWKDFTEASTKRFKDILARDDFSDVTLVSGDCQRLSAHQVILATGCSFFKNLLEGEAFSTNQKPIIFLRGVAGNLLTPLLQFLYTGRVQVSEHLIADFLVLAEDLGIEGLAKSSDDKEIVEEAPALVEEMNVSGLAVNPKIEIQDDLDRDPSGEGATNLKSEKNTPTKIIMERKHNRASKVCHNCNKPFNDASNFRRHIKKCSSGLLRGHWRGQVVMKLPRRSADGFFHCQYCGKEVKDRSNMKRHIRKSHSTQIGQTTTT